MAVELEAIGRDTQAGGERFQVTLVAENGAGDASGQPPTKTTTIALETGNVVHLPAGTDLSHPLQVGNDLEFVQPDGSIVLIPNGAVAGLTVYVGNVEIPPDTVTALFAANHIQPAEGPNGQAQGGHEFNDPGPGGIGNAFGLTPLLGPTDLSFGSTGTQPRYPVAPLTAPGPNHAPEISVTPTGLLNGGNNLVDEAGLPAGTTHDGVSDVAGGILHLADPDGAGDLKTLTVGFGGSTLTVNVADITGAVGQTFDFTGGGAHGRLIISGYDATTGSASYTYTLVTPVDEPTANNGTDIVSPGDAFSLTVTDVSGATGTASLVVDVKDDVPTANPDGNSDGAGIHTAITGNVVTGANETDPTADADVKGADGVSVTSAYGTGAAQPVGTNTVIAGQYGTLTLSSDGSYSYVRSANTAGGVSDVFNYTLTDGDGDQSSTTLTISIGDSTPTDTIPAAGGTDTIVYEAGLAARGLEPAGSQSGNVADPVTASGTVGFSSPDGVQTVSLGGHVLTGTAQTFADGTTGQLTASYSYDASTGLGTISYSYTLIDNTLTDPSSASFAVVVTDADGDSATPGNLVITIVDDVPTANPDGNSDGAGIHTAITGNVVTGANETDPTADADVKGADGVSVTSAYGTGAAQPVGTNTVIAGQYGTLTLSSDGSYSYVRSANTAGGVSDVFNYTLTDGDGDQSSTTLTISIGDSTPTDTIPAAGGTDTIVYEAGLAARGLEPAGSQSGNVADPVTASGTVGFSSPDGVQTVSLGGHVLTGTAQTFADGTTGQLTASYSYDASTGLGTISYSYTLIDNTLTDPSSASFAVVVTDADGDSATPGNLVITIVDDVPTANPDGNSDGAGIHTAITGNVVTGANETDPTADADVKGADGVSVTSAYGTGAAQPVGTNTVIAGQYGTLTLSSDGSYSYVRSANTAGGVSDVFNYTLTDGDGDQSSTTLTISIGDSTPTDTIPAAGGTDTIVYEAGLAARGLEPAGSQSGNVADPVTASGTVGFSSPDGVQTVSLGGHVLTGTAQTFADGTTGQLTASYSYDASTGLGTISYSYTLIDNTLTDPSSASFAVVVTDADGDSATPGNLVITIVDDVPTANPDGNSDGAGIHTAITGNVVTGANETDPTADADVKGADGVSVTSAYGTGAAQPVGTNTVIAGQYGTLTLSSDGSYSYVRSANTAGGVSDVFNYTLTDGDGDQSSTTLTISIGDSTPTDTIPAAGGTDTIVYEAGLAARGLEPAGSQSGNVADPVTASGTVGFSSPDGVQTVSLGGHVLTGTAQTFADGTTGQLTASYSYDASTGLGTISYSYTLIDNTLTDPSSASFAVVVTDADGDSATPGNLVITIVDDVPSVVIPDTAAMLNSIGASFTGKLDTDGNVDNNYGADGGDTRFAASLNNTDSGLTSGGLHILYSVSADGHTLTGFIDADGSGSYNPAIDTAVMTISLNLDHSYVGASDTYTVNLLGTIDGGAQSISYDSISGYTFAGGNGPWFGFLDGSTAHHDLLATPLSISGGTVTSGGTVNDTANAMGISGAASFGSGEGVRLDYVTGLAGTPGSGGDYATTARQNETYTGHYDVNGAFITLSPGNGNSTSVDLSAFVDTGSDSSSSGGSVTANEGTADNVNGVSIKFGTDSTLFSLVGHALDTIYNVVVGGHTFTVDFMQTGAGPVHAVVGGIVDGTTLGVYAVQNYNALQIDFVDTNYTTATSSTNSHTFQITDFGATSITPGLPVSLNLPVQVVDGDGDIASSSISAYLLPSPSSTADHSGDASGDSHTYGVTSTQPDVIGSTYADTITGDSSSNILYGGAGNDTITGGAGADTLIGGSGADTFTFAAGDSKGTIVGSTISGYDVISDFDASSDKLTLAGTPVVVGDATGSASLTYAGVTIGSYTITNGVIAFYSDTSLTTQLTLASNASIAAAVNYIQQNHLLTLADQTVAFNATLSGVNHVFVYEQIGTSPSATSDLLIDLSNPANFTNLSSLTTSHLDPIVLELDHSGYSFTSIENGVQFDINADGAKDHVAWTTPNEGLLAIDLNHDGKIDDGSELFTTSFNHQQFATGLDALASLDTNHDGLIDAGDVDFSKLVVWNDANGDGISQPSELTTLADNGISSIGLAATPTDTSVDGQEVTAEGTVTHVDGSTSGYAEVSLDTSLGSPTPLLGVTDSSSFNDGFDWDNIVVPPADGSNTLQGTDGADKFTLTDLHAVELIADYNFDQGDSIDLSVLLGHNSGVTQQNVADHVHYDSTTGALSVAETGAGGAPEFIDVAVLNHPVPDVKVVLDDGVDVTINHLG